MLKIAAGLADVVLCLLLIFAEPSFSQTPRPPAPSPQPSPSPQLDAQPTPKGPEQPADATQQKGTPRQDTSQGKPTPVQHGKVVSHRRHEARPRRNEAEGGRVGDSYVTAWSGPYVIERAHDYDAFVVEGRWYRAQSVCPGWEAGERVSLRAGPPGWCALVNRTRHQACVVSCDGRPGWGPYL
jgi:hypothetical protein